MRSRGSYSAELLYLIQADTLSVLHTTEVSSGFDWSDLDLMRLVEVGAGPVMESNSCDVMLAITQSAVCLWDQLITPQSARQLISDTASVFVDADWALLLRWLSGNSNPPPPPPTTPLLWLWRLCGMLAMTILVVSLESQDIMMSGLFYFVRER